MPPLVDLLSVGHRVVVLCGSFLGLLPHLPLAESLHVLCHRLVVPLARLAPAAAAHHVELRILACCLLLLFGCHLIPALQGFTSLQDIVSKVVVVQQTLDADVHRLQQADQVVFHLAPQREFVGCARTVGCDVGKYLLCCLGVSLVVLPVRVDLVGLVVDALVDVTIGTVEDEFTELIHLRLVAHQRHQSLMSQLLMADGTLRLFGACLFRQYDVYAVVIRVVPSQGSWLWSLGLILDLHATKHVCRLVCCIDLLYVNVT